MNPQAYSNTMSTYKPSDYSRASQLRTGLQDAIADSASGFFEPIMESVEVANNYRRCIHALLDATPEVIEMRTEIAALKKMLESSGGIEMNINDPMPDGSSKVDDIYREFGEENEPHKKTVHAHIPGDTITSRLVDFQTYLKTLESSVSHTDILAHFEEIFQDVVEPDEDESEDASSDEGSQFSEPVFRKPPGQKLKTKSKKLKLIEEGDKTADNILASTVVLNILGKQNDLSEEELALRRKTYQEEIMKRDMELRKRLAENEEELRRERQEQAAADESEEEDEVEDDESEEEEEEEVDEAEDDEEEEEAEEEEVDEAEDDEEEEEEEAEDDEEEAETDDESVVPTKERTPPVEEAASDSEEEFFLVELEDEDGEPMSFYTQDEENGDIYEVLDDEEIGDKIGVFKDGEPELF